MKHWSYIVILLKFNKFEKYNKKVYNKIKKTLSNLFFKGEIICYKILKSKQRL
ncbi:hypothetical protein CNEO4_580014 [Clostridium neonatale]|nr:hypothetical protein CNEO3_60050 [Clostridium neonatale]CAI3694059.1 hypothetical protein CNEO4_580014 [Clostridium neonatale]